MSDTQQQPRAADKTVRDGETLRQREEERFEDLIDDIEEGLALLLNAHGPHERQQARSFLKANLVRALIHNEPNLRESEYWDGVELGEISYTNPQRDAAVYPFHGLQSIVNNRDGVSLRVFDTVDAAGDGPSSGSVTTRNFEIPDDVLVNGVRVFLRWAHDIDASLSIDDEQEEMEFEYELIEDYQEYVSGDDE